MSIVEINNQISPPLEVHLQGRCLEINKKKISYEQQHKILKLSEKLTPVEISEEMNIPYQKVYYFLKKNKKYKKK